MLHSLNICGKIHTQALSNDCHIQSLVDQTGEKDKHKQPTKQVIHSHWKAQDLPQPRLQQDRDLDNL
jgi:hypothetical protein